MTLFDYYKLFWQRAFNFTGRSRRKEYWAATLFNSIFIFIFLASIFIEDHSISKILYFLYVIFILIIAIPNLSLCIRRLHDVGKSGWFYLIGFIPIINLWPVALILFVDSEPHTNQWGEDPKKDERIKIH
jgi:hypothetical protein